MDAVPKLRGRPEPFLAVPRTRQATSHTCGCAALQAVLGYFGIDEREGYLAEECGAGPEHGTRNHRISAYARSVGLAVDTHCGWTWDELSAALAKGVPVVVALQAWHDDVAHPEFDYGPEWEDGHYVVVCGLDDRHVYLMDPSTLGAYCFLPRSDFEQRWHDYEVTESGQRVELVHFGMAFSGRACAFDENEFLYMG